MNTVLPVRFLVLGLRHICSLEALYDGQGVRVYLIAVLAADGFGSTILASDGSLTLALDGGAIVLVHRVTKTFCRL